MRTEDENGLIVVFVLTLVGVALSLFYDPWRQATVKRVMC